MVKLVERRNPDPKFYSAGFLFFVQLVHVSFLLVLIKEIFDLHYFVFSKTYLVNKLYWMPLAIVWLIVVNIYYNKRYPELVKLYEGKEIITTRNTIIVFSLLLIPLIFTIILSMR